MTTPGAAQPLGMTDFFALEAGEYLDRLDGLLQATATPPADELVRLARALRGSALMASQQPIARAAMGFEALARALRGGRRQWDAATKQMAATSIAHAAREVAERGRPDPESAEFRRFAGLLVKFMDSEPDIVPIETLGTIVRRGTAATPTRPATLGRLELVSHGEHLRQAADSLERAPSATQRELRAHTLAGTFRVLGAAGGGPVAERVAEFAQAAREAVSSGIAVNQAAHFAAELRKAGEVLSASGSGDETSTAAALAAVTIAIRRLGGGAAVPIESLAPTHSQPAAPAPAAPSPPSTPADRARRSGAVREPVGGGRGGAESATDIAGTWMVYQRMVAAGIGPASLEELIAGRTNGEPVDIGRLLYKGASARQRAQELREAAKRASGESLRAIIDEVCDLVVLAIEPE